SCSSSWGNLYLLRPSADGLGLDCPNYSPWAEIPPTVSCLTSTWQVPQSLWESPFHWPWVFSPGYFQEQQRCACAWLTRSGGFEPWPSTSFTIYEAFAPAGLPPSWLFSESPGPSACSLLCFRSRAAFMPPWSLPAPPITP